MENKDIFWLLTVISFENGFIASQCRISLTNKCESKVHLFLRSIYFHKICFRVKWIVVNNFVTNLFPIPRTIIKVEVQLYYFAAGYAVSSWLAHSNSIIARHRFFTIADIKKLKTDFSWHSVYFQSMWFTHLPILTSL